MKKSLIALAVAAALPVAAQADVTLSGSVSAEYTLGSNLNPDTSTSLSASSSEVLSNGMTATASFDVLGNDSQGTISLSGDFGTVTGGTAAASLADVADSSATDTNDEAADLDGISYTGSIAGLTVHAMAGQFDDKAYDDANGDAVNNTVKYVKYGASYDLNGLTISGSSTAEDDVAETSLSASYSFGDLTVSATKDQGADAVVKAAYAATMGDLAVSVSADSGNAWDLSATYTMGDIAITATDDEEAGGADISAAYASGALSVSVDSDSDVTVAYDLGNADLTLVREDDETKVKYTVAF
jgi:hypothetical protein